LTGLSFDAYFRIVFCSSDRLTKSTFRPIANEFSPGKCARVPTVRRSCDILNA